jgi:hypothetical protein
MPELITPVTRRPRLLVRRSTLVMPVTRGWA